MGESQTRTPGDLTISAIDAASPAAMGPARLRAWMRQARSRLTRRWPALHYAVVRQYDTADCGAAALLTVLRFHGGDASAVMMSRSNRIGNHRPDETRQVKAPSERWPDADATCAPPFCIDSLPGTTFAAPGRAPRCSCSTRPRLARGGRCTSALCHHGVVRTFPMYFWRIRQLKADLIA